MSLNIVYNNYFLHLLDGGVTSCIAPARLRPRAPPHELVLRVDRAVSTPPPRPRLRPQPRAQARPGGRGSS